MKNHYSEKRNTFTFYWVFVAVLSVFLLKPVLTSGVPVDSLTALQVAENLFYERSEGLSRNSDLQANIIKTCKQGDTLLYYVVSVNNDRYALIAADDAVYPVLSYSFNAFPRGKFPPAYEAWIKSVRAEILAAIRYNITAPSYVRQEWAYYSDSSNINSGQVDAVSPLITSIWHQGPPYNEDCPYSASSAYPNNHVPVGCVAIAMGQIMNYWSHPGSGTGSHSYTSNYGVESANFGNTNYDYANMPDNLTSSSSPAEKAAVAELLYHSGVSVDMMYGDNGSGAYSQDAAIALINYFNYDNSSMSFEAKDYSTNWDGKLKADLDNGIPVYYAGTTSSGSGHAFILDGYQGSGNDHYHINWGWGAGYNNYCYLTSLVASGVQTDFSFDQRAIFGIQPSSFFSVGTNSVVLNSPANSSQSVAVKTSMNWTASTGTSWLSVTPSGGSSSDSIVITANSANTSSSSRNGSVTVTAGSMTETIYVVQGGTQVAGSAAWFNPAIDLLEDWYASYSDVNLYGNPLLVDSTMVYLLGTSSSQHVTINHVGAVCDPYSPFYQNVYSDTTSYILDSLYVGGLYDIDNSGYTDTLIFEIVHNQPETAPSFAGVFIPVTNDTLWFSPPSMLGSTVLQGWEAKLTDPNKTVIKKPLTVSDSSNSVHAVDVPDINIPAGQIIGVSVSYKPGYSYSFGDVLFNFNTNTVVNNTFRYLLYEVSNASLNPNYFYDPFGDQGRYNLSYSINSAGRYGIYGNQLLNEIMYPQLNQGNHIGFKLKTSGATFAVNPGMITLDQASNSSQTVSVTSNGNWSASTTEPWLSVSPSSGTNAGNITITATSANTGTSSRSGTVTVSEGSNSETVVVTQEPAQLDVSQQSVSIGVPANSSQTINVISNISWTATTAESWLSVSPSGGSNNAGLTITANSANTGSSSRTGSITVSGGGINRTITVIQQAADLILTPQNITLASSDNSSQTVTLNSNINWSATSAASWLDVSPNTGSNNEVLTVTATTANTGSSTRTATVDVSGSGLSGSITVHQEASQLSLSPQSISLDNHANASQTASLTANMNWNANVNTYWLDVSPSSGSSNTSLTITANSANPDSTTRTGQITVTGSGLTETIDVDQTGSLLAVGQQSITLTETANASQTVAVSSNLNWDAITNDPWLDVSPSSGSDNGSVTITALTDNPYHSVRTGNVDISGNGINRNIMVEQLGDTTTGVDQTGMEDRIIIYPNPNNGNFKISGNNVRESILHVKIYNMQGQTLYSRKIETKQKLEFHQEIKLENISAGMYYLEVSGEKFRKREKLVVY
ncbi:MAG: C10 family peptidase [Bacteroidales bacterium]